MSDASQLSFDLPLADTPPTCKIIARPDDAHNPLPGFYQLDCGKPGQTISCPPSKLAQFELSF